jgi:hypothetical protein
LFSRYNTSSPSRGIANGYAAAVMAAIRWVKAASPNHALGNGHHGAGTGVRS